MAQPLSTGTRVSCSGDLFKHFHPALRDLKHELFKVVLLDAKNTVLKETTVSEGSLTLSIVHPREVFAFAVRESAAAVILLHNHPSGDPTPSLEDRQLTDRLVAVGKLLGIRVLDHVIIGDSRYVSFADEGWLKRARENPSIEPTCDAVEGGSGNQTVIHTPTKEGRPWKTSVWSPSECRARVERRRREDIAQ